MTFKAMRFGWLSVPLALIALVPCPLGAQEVQPSADPVPLTEALASEFDESIDTISQQRSEIAVIETRFEAADGVFAEILERRLFQERLDVLIEGIDFARAVSREAEAGYIVDDYRARAIEILQVNQPVAADAWNELDARGNIPDPGLSVAEQAALNRRFFDTERGINRIIVLIGDSLELLAEFGVPVDAALDTFRARLRDRATNASVYLQIAQDMVGDTRAGLSALQGDADLVAQLSVAESLVSQIARLFQEVVAELDAIDEETALYRQQIITATGEITPDAFNFAVISQLISAAGTSIADFLTERGPGILFRVLVFVLIVYLSLKASRIARTIVERGLNRSNASFSQLLQRMIVSAAANLILAIGVLLGLSQIGISLGPLLAGLGIAGFIVGFALQDSLANFASGLMILFYRPYDVGDIIRIGDLSGTVGEMSLVNTTIHTFDNQRIIVPNTMIWTGTITNVTAAKQRRVDLVFGISYSDDISKTEAILNDIVRSHELVLDDPAPTIKLHELGDSSVNFVVRPWTETEHYWDVYWDLTRAVKMRFDAEGISIPFPQRDVHLFSQPGHDQALT